MSNPPCPCMGHDEMCPCQNGLARPTPTLNTLEDYAALGRAEFGALPMRHLPHIVWLLVKAVVREGEK